MKLFLIELPEPPLPPEVQAKLLSLLPVAAQERISRFYHVEDAIRSLVGRLAPIWYLRHAGLVDQGALPTFGRKAKGKPTLVGRTHTPFATYLNQTMLQVEPKLDPALDLNDSHDGSFVLFGSVRGQEVDIGVDLMKIPLDPKDIQEGISEQLSPEEKHALALPLSDHERAKRLTTLWTFKEGYTKAIGQGVGFGLDRITLALDQRGDVEGVCVDGEDIRWDGWKWAKGWIESKDGLHKEEYGWVAIWRGDPDWDGQLTTVTWDDFLRTFMTDEK